MNRSFNKSQPLRSADCNAVEVKSKVSDGGGGGLSALNGYLKREIKSSHGCPVRALELVGQTVGDYPHRFSLCGDRALIDFFKTGAECTGFCLFL